jgi:hypothetical protein
MSRGAIASGTPAERKLTTVSGFAGADGDAEHTPTMAKDTAKASSETASKQGGPVFAAFPGREA